MQLIILKEILKVIAKIIRRLRRTLRLGSLLKNFNLIILIIVRISTIFLILKHLNILRIINIENLVCWGNLIYIYTNISRQEQQ